MNKSLEILIGALVCLFVSSGYSFQIWAAPLNQRVYGPVYLNERTHITLDGCAIMRSNGQLHFVWDSDSGGPNMNDQNITVNLPPPPQAGMSYSPTFFPVTQATPNVQVQVWVTTCGPIEIDVISLPLPKK